MKIKDLLLEFGITFCAAFLVTSVVGYVYRLFIHSNQGIDWVTSFKFGLIFAIILPWVHYKDRKKKDNNK
ncbi:MAG: hypothetical protein Q8903_09700 [Bacteroidota bacterium]|nr:hypothetical protein [Bacteroidota bacterium]